MIWLANNWRLVLFGFLLLACISLAGMASHYRGEMVDADVRAASAETIAQQRQDTINDMQVRQRDVAALDAKYTGEIASAQKTIDGLRNDVTAGNVRLRIAIARAKQQAATGSVGDGETAELAESARQDYFRLREMIAKQESQVLYLQEYIQQQCLK